MIFNVSGFIIFSLLVWFDTDAFVEYASLLPKNLRDILKIDEYKMVSQDGNISYPDFLLEYHNSFFTRLLSCPICLSTWLGLLTSISTGLGCFATIVIGLTGYKLLKWLMTI